MHSYGIAWKSNISTLSYKRDGMLVYSGGDIHLSTRVLVDRLSLARQNLARLALAAATIVCESISQSVALVMSF
jgi:hypothetical protein